MNKSFCSLCRIFEFKSWNVNAASSLADSQGLATFMSQSEKVKGWFTNSGALCTLGHEVYYAAQKICICLVRVGGVQWVCVERVVGRRVQVSCLFVHEMRSNALQTSSILHHRKAEEIFSRFPSQLRHLMMPGNYCWKMFVVVLRKAQITFVLNSGNRVWVSGWVGWEWELGNCPGSDSCVERS